MLRRLFPPQAAFQGRARDARTLPSSLARLLLLRLPVTAASWCLVLVAYRGFRADLAEGRGFIHDALKTFPQKDLDPEALRILADLLPQAPPLLAALPWILLLAPLATLSLWLHDAVWDHGCLWIMGVRGKAHPFRRTALAVSEALQVATVSAGLGVLAAIPGLGFVLRGPHLALAVYVWILRGYALAEWQDCPAWKGVAATVLHAALAVVLFVLMLAATWYLAPTA